MKKLLPLLLCVCILFSGCDFISFTVDELLSAPTIADEQTAIYQALIAKTGRDVRLEYPRNGLNRSAFIIENIDGDDEEEALAFYSFGDGENVKLCVLDKQADGSWVFSYEMEGKGEHVEKVYVNSVSGRVDIIVAYGTTGYVDQSLEIYRYHQDALLTLHDSVCSIAEVYDLDGDGNVEVISVGKAGLNTQAMVITNPNGVNYTTHDASFSGILMSVPSYSIGKISDTNSAIYVDVMDESGYIYTELLYFSEEGLLCPGSSIPGMRNATRRSYGYYSIDYDGDGSVEIPLNESFIGYSSGSWSGVPSMTTWLSYNSDRLAFTREAYSYYDIEEGYVFKLPNRWVGVVSVIEDNKTGEVTFIKYDTNVDNLEEMTPIMSFLSVDSSESLEDYLAGGYEIITSDGYKSYLVKIIADETEPLVLTPDEIINNFHAVKR